MKTDREITDVGFNNDLPKKDKTETVTRSLATLTTDVDKVKIATLVFFDIETTGLPNRQKNVEITEISMIAVGRNEFCKCTHPDLSDIRIVHKLSLCIKPKSSISPSATRLTGLSDSNLQDQEPFDQNTATVILHFLSHLQKPICILAHNGKCFDFPILKAEFKNLNMQLPSNFYIIDTLDGFKKLGPLPTQELPKGVKLKKNGEISCSLQNLHLYFFGKHYIGSHSSEGDCIALAKVCHKVRDKIIPWIDENCLTFDSIKAMW